MANDYGAYNSIIEELRRQQGSLGQIFQPQVRALEGTLPTIQQRYGTLLDEVRRQTAAEGERLGKQETHDVGSEQVRAASAGVAPVYGTAEMAAIQQIQDAFQRAIAGNTAQGQAKQQELTAQQAGEEANIRTQIANILARQTEASNSIAAQIAQAQSAARAAAEEKARWERQFAEAQRQFNANLGSSGRATSQNNLQNALQAALGVFGEEDIRVTGKDSADKLLSSAELANSRKRINEVAKLYGVNADSLYSQAFNLGGYGEWKPAPAQQSSGGGFSTALKVGGIGAGIIAALKAPSFLRGLFRR